MPSPIRERGYPHPELLAETDWLVDHLADPSVRVVDARSDDDYAAGHIPGAVHISGFALGGIGPETFASMIGALGIDEHTPVVVYDAGGASQMAQMAGMTGWTLLYHGHRDVRYLDGGMAKWMAEGLPLSTDVPAHEGRTFTAPMAKGVVCTLDQARALVADGDAVLWDVRTTGEFDGSQAGWDPPPRLGHIPGAVQLEYHELFDADDGTLKPAAELTTILGAVGITPEAKVVTY